MDVHFCIEALHKAFQQGTPEIFNSDSRFTVYQLCLYSCLERRAIQISMDGRGRALTISSLNDCGVALNTKIFISRIIKMVLLNAGTENYFLFYNEQRPHQSLDYKHLLKFILTKYVPKPLLIFHKNCLDFGGPL